MCQEISHLFIILLFIYTIIQYKPPNKSTKVDIWSADYEMTCYFMHLSLKFNDPETLLKPDLDWVIWLQNKEHQTIMRGKDKQV